MNKKERIIMSDIFDSRDLLDELKTLDKEYDEEQQEKNFYEWCSMYDDTKHIKKG